MKMSISSRLTAAALATLFASLYAAVPSALADPICAPFEGGHDILCLFKGAAGLKQAVTIVTPLQLPVTFLETDWLTTCGSTKGSTSVKTRSLPDGRPLTLPAVMKTTSQCLQLLLNGCAVSSAGKSRPIPCGSAIEPIEPR